MVWMLHLSQNRFGVQWSTFATVEYERGFRTQMNMNLNAKQIRVIGVALLLPAGLAGWFMPRLFDIRPTPVRVVILATAVTLWFSVFEILSAISRKRKLSLARIAIVFGVGMLYFGLVEFYIKSHPLLVLIPGAIGAFVSAAVIINRRLQ